MGPISLSQRIIELREHLTLGEMKEMRSLLSAVPERTEIVVTFLASLELSRLKKLKLYQDGTYEPIFLELIESLETFNLGLASGFDALPLETPLLAEASTPEGI